MPLKATEVVVADLSFQFTNFIDFFQYTIKFRVKSSWILQAFHGNKCSDFLMFSSHFFMLDWWRSGLKLVMPARTNTEFFYYTARTKSLEQLKGIYMEDRGWSDMWPVPSLAAEWHMGRKYNPEKMSPFHLLTKLECNISHCNDTAWNSEIFPQLDVLREMGQSQGHH